MLALHVYNLLTLVTSVFVTIFVFLFYTRSIFPEFNGIRIVPSRLLSSHARGDRRLIGGLIFEYGFADVFDEDRDNRVWYETQAARALA
jgi:hypothetical protein